MGPFEAQVITTFMGIVGGLTGLGLIMRFLLRKRELDRKGVADPRLAETVEDLRHEMEETRAELLDVQERLDFAERLLTKGGHTPPRPS